MPSEIVHVNITKAAMIELRRRPHGEIPNELSDGILEGVVDPDKTPDEVYVRISKGAGYYRPLNYEKDHYYPHTELIRYYFDLSLYHLRRGTGRRTAGFMLGRTTLRPGLGLHMGGLEARG